MGLHATMAVMTSPAPLANAIRVTAAIASDSFRVSLIQVIPSAIYSSTVADINWKMKQIIKTAKGRNIYRFPTNFNKLLKN